MLTGTKSDMLVLAETLEEKYGKPLKKNTTVANKMGTQFDKEIFIWVDNLGPRITVESIHSNVNNGQVVIQSASDVAAQDAAEKMVKEAGKSNL